MSPCTLAQRSNTQSRHSAHVHAKISLSLEGMFCDWALQRDRGDEQRDSVHLGQEGRPRAQPALSLALPHGMCQRARQQQAAREERGQGHCKYTKLCRGADEANKHCNQSRLHFHKHPLFYPHPLFIPVVISQTGQWWFVWLIASAIPLKKKKKTLYRSLEKILSC